MALNLSVYLYRLTNHSLVRTYRSIDATPEYMIWVILSPHLQKHAFIHDRYQPGRISRHQKLEQIPTGSSFEGPSGPSFFTFAEDYSSANIFQLFSREGKKEKKRKLETRGNQLITETTQILKQSANQHININISYGHTCPAQKVHKAPRFKLTLQGSKTG